MLSNPCILSLFPQKVSMIRKHHNHILQTNPRHREEEPQLFLINSIKHEHSCKILYVLLQGLHRLEHYLNLEGLLEKSLNIKSAFKSTGKSLKSLEKSLNSTIFCRTVAL